jgi:hypothetical protein
VEKKKKNVKLIYEAGEEAAFKCRQELFLLTVTLQK